MTDLETACRELVEKWERWLPPEDKTHAPAESHVRECKRDLERVLAEQMDPDVKHLVEQMEDAT
jgi:hypothetical protein